MFRSAIIAVIGLLTVCVAAQAQAPGFVPRPGPVYTPPPAFSPYLNLLRNGTPAGVNYYGLVRPQIEFRNAMQNLQGQVNMNQQMIGQMQSQQNQQMGDTGHATMFMNLNGYFMNSGGVGGNRGNPGMNTYRTPQTGNAGAMNRGGMQTPSAPTAPQAPRR